MSRLGYGRVAVIVDIGEYKFKRMPNLAAKEKWRVRHWVTFAAAQGDEPTLDPESGPVSAFTQSVLQGLRGGADLTGGCNQDGKVNAGELIDFTQSQLGQLLSPLGGT